MKILYSLWVLVLFSCCPLDKMSRQIRAETAKQYKGAILVAKVIEPVHFYLVFQKDNHFILSHRSSDLQPCGQNYYAGYYQKKKDTIGLSFTHEFKPIQMESYLVYDSTQKIFLYPYKDKNTQLKLEIIYNDPIKNF